MNDLASASQMYRHANCAGNRILIRSLRAEKLIPEEFEGEMSPEASVGQRIHAAIEGHPEPLTLSESEIMDDCNRLAYRCAAQVFPNKTLDIVREERLTYEIQKVPVFTGKPDLVYRTGDECLDINFKTGRKPSQDSNINLQLRSEVVLLYKAHGLQRVYAAIIEPLVSSGPEISLYEADDLKKAEAEILEIVDRTEYVETRTAGPWCRHCPARGLCPESRQLAISAPVYLHAAPLPEGDEGARLLEQIELAIPLLRDIQAQYAELVKNKFNAIPGWHIGHGRNIRSIDAGAALLKLASLGIDGRALIKESMTVTELEETMSKEWKMRGVAFDKRFAKEFRDAIKTHRTKGSLEKIPKRLLK